MRWEHINKEELNRAIRKVKRRKATGPDEIPTEILKELDDGNLDNVVEIIRDWWTNESTPAEELEARVVLIYKKKETPANSKTTDQYLN